MEYDFMIKTDWDNVAAWYDDHLETTNDSYQARVIAPNLLRILAPKKGEQILDLACGQGYFSRLVQEEGAAVTGVDLSKALIARAQEKDTKGHYIVAPAHETTLTEHSFDTIFTVLAFENIRDIDAVVAEIARLLKKDGRFIVVLLHPSFRIPQHADWYFDAKKHTQYRTVAKYLSEVTIAITQNPFKGGKEITTKTFHRPLQWYVKLFKKHQLSIVGLEEWISHKKSQPGPRQKIEDAARKEIPMFLCLEVMKR